MAQRVIAAPPLERRECSPPCTDGSLAARGAGSPERRKRSQAPGHSDEAAATSGGGVLISFRAGLGGGQAAGQLRGEQGEGGDGEEGGVEEQPPVRPGAPGEEGAPEGGPWGGAGGKEDSFQCLTAPLPVCHPATGVQQSSCC